MPTMWHARASQAAGEDISRATCTPNSGTPKTYNRSMRIICGVSATLPSASMASSALRIASSVVSWVITTIVASVLLRQSGNQIGGREIVTFKKEWRVARFGKRIGRAVAHV